MCFETTIFSPKRIAKSPIKCYKAVFKVNKDTCLAPYLEYSYNKNVINKLNENLEKDEYILFWKIIYKGFHSCKKPSLTKKHSERFGGIPTGVFEIPIGASYYKNLDGEYVSDAIIFKGYLEPVAK